jgi:hypothetical protein
MVLSYDMFMNFVIMPYYMYIFLCIMECIEIFCVNNDSVWWLNNISTEWGPCGPVVKHEDLEGGTKS